MRYTQLETCFFLLPFYPSKFDLHREKKVNTAALGSIHLKISSTNRFRDKPYLAVPHFFLGTFPPESNFMGGRINNENVSVTKRWLFPKYPARMPYRLRSRYGKTGSAADLGHSRWKENRTEIAVPHQKMLRVRLCPLSSISRYG